MKMTITIFVLLFIQVGHSAELNNVQLFYRCYNHLTGSEPMPNDALLLSVKNGADPIEVCLSDILRSADLTAGTGEWNINTADPLAMKVFNHFYAIHASWFPLKDIPAGAGVNPTNNLMRAVYDENQPSLYYTRALFDPTLKADYFLTTSEFLRAKRSDGLKTNEDGAFYHLGKKSGGVPYVASDFVFGTFDTAFDQGDLVGMRLPITNTVDISSWAPNVNYPLEFRDINPNNNSITVFPHYGGGIIGSGIYLARSLEEEAPYVADGASLVPRNWSKHAFKDILCRDIPVVRKEDAAPFFDATSDSPFRKGADCLRCHSTIDRMAGVIKSAGFMETRPSHQAQVWVPWVTTSLQNQGDGSEATWSSNVRADYIKEPHVGHLFYRTYEGQLISYSVDSIDDIGNAWSKEVDPYLCVAKRYYNYFTKIDINIADPGADPAPLPAWEQSHKDFIVKIAKELGGLDSQGSQQARLHMRTIIEKIMRSPNYRKTNFGVPNE
jgi:hypothetical protein